MNAKVEPSVMKVDAVWCRSCNWAVFSRTRYDFRRCPCGAVAIDGGFDYLKVSWDPGSTPPEIVKLSINSSRQELHDDYVKARNIYGLVKMRTNKKSGGRKRKTRSVKAPQ